MSCRTGDQQSPLLLVLALAAMLFFGCQPANQNPVADNPEPPANGAETPSALFSQPHYFVLAIGPNQEKKMPVVVRGNQLSIDLNGDGSADGESEQFTGRLDMEYEGTRFYEYLIGELVHGEVKHSDTKVRVSFGADVRASVATLLEGQFPSSCSSQGLEMVLAEEMANAPLVHFGGNLTMDWDVHPTKVRMGRSDEIYAHVGTAGRGVGTLTAIEHANIPADVHPKYEIKFPHVTPGEDPIVVTGYLNFRC